MTRLCLATPTSSKSPLPQHILKVGQVVRAWICGWVGAPIWEALHGTEDDVFSIHILFY